MVHTQPAATKTASARQRGRPVGSRGKSRLRNWTAITFKNNPNYKYDKTKTPEENEAAKWERDAKGNRIVALRQNTRTIQRHKVQHYQRRRESVVPNTRIVGFVREFLGDLQGLFETSARRKTKISLSKNVHQQLNEFVDQHGNHVLNLARRLHEHSNPNQYRMPERSVAFAVNTVAPTWWEPIAHDGVNDESPVPASKRRSRRLASLRDEEPPEADDADEIDDEVDDDEEDDDDELDEEEEDEDEDE